MGQGPREPGEPLIPREEAKDGSFGGCPRVPTSSGMLEERHEEVK